MRKNLIEIMEGRFVELEEKITETLTRGSVVT